jgi:hypothetical protein
MLHHLSLSDLKQDGLSFALAYAPFAILSAVPAAVWLSLISILVTAYFRRQELKLRREEMRRLDEIRELRARVAELTRAETAGATDPAVTREGGSRGFSR